MTAGKEVLVIARGPTGADVQIIVDGAEIKGVVDADLTMSPDDMNRLTITVIGTIADITAVMMLPIQLKCPVCADTVDHDCQEFKRDQSSSGAGLIPRP